MRHFLAVSFVSFGISIAQDPPPAARPTEHVGSARTEADAELAPLLVKMAEMVKAGADGAALLAAKELQPLREVTRFRDTVRERAPKGEVAIAPAGEPGTPLVVRGLIQDSDRKPLAGALLYAYHTSAKGWYGERAPHFRGGTGQGGDVGHARLFAYVRTDDQGRFVLKTIRPGGYPESELPEHIHWHVTVDDKGVAGGEILFDDDARLSAEERQRSGEAVTKPVKQADGSLLVQPVLTIDKKRLPAK
jgi:protocatechuate 3,4-dioxygenase beta subunit